MSAQYASNTITPQKQTIMSLQALKQAGEKISCLTAYDATFAGLIQRAGIDVILVGDSLGMVVQGHDSTLRVTLDEMLYHTELVRRGAAESFIIADLTFMSDATPLLAAENAARLIQQGGARMVKLEGAKTETIAYMVDQGIPVCGHLGLLPQRIYQQGEYRVQGKSEQAAEQIISDALALEKAGIQLLILECVPAQLAANISQQLTIPVIGIGAGSECDGQVLVSYDMLGLSLTPPPRFTKNYMQQSASIFDALLAYHDDVKNGRFPTLAESF